MKKKLVITVLAVCVGSLHANFSNTIGYQVTVPHKSSWGVVVSSGVISNNKGVAGVVKGSGSGLLCSPSLAYGVTQWAESSIKSYVCAKGEKPTKPSATTCAIESKATGDTVDYAEYFENAERALHTNVESSIQTLIESYPDFGQGQGYLSDAYISFSSSLGAENVTASENQLVNVSQQVNQMQSAIGTLNSTLNDLEEYFDGSFVVALDFTTLSGK